MFKNALQLSALILSVVNGLILLSNWLQNKPKMQINPIHPDIYQWWVKLPTVVVNGKEIRRWAFLLYINIDNLGNKGCELRRYRLRVKNRLWPWWFWKSSVEMRAVNIPQPQIPIGNHLKLFPVIGQKTEIFDGETFLEAGRGISGMLCYLYQVHGREGWDPRIEKNGIIKPIFEVDNLFGKRVSRKLICREKPLAFIQRILPDFDFHADNDDSELGPENTSGDVR